MSFDLAFDAGAITLTLLPDKAGLLGRFLPKRRRDLDHLPADDRTLLLALADLRALADGRPDELALSGDRIRLSHRLAAELPGPVATALGLPPLVDLTLETDAEGIVGAPGFRLHHHWTKNGVRQMPARTGAILETANGLRRLPVWMLDALDIAARPRTAGDDAADWAALARFRQALDPGVRMVDDGPQARASMSDYLSGLRVRLADCFAVSPNADGTDFDVLPFSGESLAAGGFAEGEIPEAAAELSGGDLSAFRSRLADRGALSAYRLAPGSFLVVDPAAAPALKVMAEMRRAPLEERRAFVRNPRARITAAVEADLRARGVLDALSPEAEEEAVEGAAGRLFVETQEFSARVTGVTVYEKSAAATSPSGTTWLPEHFTRALAEALAGLSADDLRGLRAGVADAIARGEPVADIAGVAVPARSEALDLLDVHIDRAAADGRAKEDTQGADTGTGPVVLDTLVNFETLQWIAGQTPRMARVPAELPAAVRTPLKAHQHESFRWQVAAWQAGLPGILNADEQGLGKTLQTIAFLVWLKTHTARPEAEARGPVLVVAPTSLLRTWEEEVKRHVAEPGLGLLFRLYGSAISAYRATGARGRDTDAGVETLDFGQIHAAVAEGRAHRFWILTTYTTLTNYQHSLGRIPFAAAVFDEIQTLKNPDSLRAAAARAMNADFRLGLTGTPIENATEDLWAVMDQLAPGSVGSLREFRARYGTPDEAAMRALHARVFTPIAGRPPLAQRRLKETVATDLPPKTRRLHPRPMPPGQAATYEAARLKLAEGGAGAALKMLHHIRTVSVHPALDAGAGEADFIAASGRLAATFDILREIAARRERALVFIENLQMQQRFIALARVRFGLERIDLINGNTAIARRQEIVERFQEQGAAPGFNLLVLGPKAAGTGLTLTAATHVIHLSRWWNPAVEEQCNDRVHRIGQTRPVTVHVPMAIHPGYREHSFDCLLQSLMQRKRRLASRALWPMGDTAEDVAALCAGLEAAAGAGTGDPVLSAMVAMFSRDGLPAPVPAADGSVAFP